MRVGGADGLETELEVARSRIATLEHTIADQARFRTILETTDDVIVLTTAEGLVTYLSPSAQRVLGDSAMLGTRPMTWVHPDDRAFLIATRERLLAEPSRRVVVEARFQLPDGGSRWFEVRGINMLADPTVHALVITLEDITQRHEVTAALAESEQRYRQVVESAPAPIVVHVAQKIVYANAASARALGVTDAAAMIGRSIVDFATPETRLAIAQRQEVVAMGGSAL